MPSFLKLRGLVINTTFIQKVEEIADGRYKQAYRIYVTTHQESQEYYFTRDRDTDDYEAIRQWIESL
jgi:hypothetical protein